MQNTKLLAELKLTGKHQLKFTWHPSTRSLYVELQEAATKEDGHGFYWRDGCTLEGAELRAFAEAIAGLREPQPPQAA